MEENTNIIVKENKVSKRVLYYDILNILAIFAVIALHCNGVVHKYNASNQRAWATSLIVEVLFYWAVPIFVMLTGATLMKYRDKYDTKTFFKKRVLKVLVPFLFWAVIMFIWKYQTAQLKINEFTIRNILNMFFANKEESTYYFMFVILGVYLTMPFLSVLADDKYRNVCWYTVIAFFITKSLIPVILSVFKISYNNDLSIQLGTYIIFPLLGYLLSTQNLTKKQRIVIYILGFLSACFRYGLTYYWTVSSGKLDNTIKGYQTFHSVLLACAVFVFIKQIDFTKILRSDRIRKILADIAGCSFGIYLIHKIIMHYEIKLFDINVYSWQWRVFGIFTTYFVCLGIVFILKKIPFVKKVLP